MHFERQQNTTLSSVFHGTPNR